MKKKHKVLYNHQQHYGKQYNQGSKKYSRQPKTKQQQQPKVEPFIKWKDHMDNQHADYKPHKNQHQKNKQSILQELSSK